MSQSFEPKPKIICLTPVKNDAWILKRFLECASLWADVIIIADQNSDDDSREIALKYDKVKLIENLSNDLNQGIQQKLLLDAARQIPGPRILIALDADEMLTGNFLDNPEWQTILHAPPGTIGEFQLVNILPNFDSYWWLSTSDFHYSFIFVDDESDYVGKSIHCGRIPEPPYAPRIRLKSIKLLHYSYADWTRAQSKQRWYQCWEIINRPSRNKVGLYRFCNLMESFPKEEIFAFEKGWISGYEALGIDMTSVYKESIYWRDKQILEWLSKYGCKKFRKLAIWHIDWADMARKSHLDIDEKKIKDPRNLIDKLIHKWLQETQPFHRKLAIRVIDKLIGLFWG